MYEIEMKLPVESAEEAEARLIEQGFILLQRIREEDHYYDNDASQIRNNGEALRVRSVTDLDTGAEEAVITFKGKRMDTVSKSRKELETGVSDRDVAMEIFSSIGFHAVSPSVIKTRQEYEKGRMHACLDRIEGLGDFLELEIVIAKESDKDAAQEEIRSVLETLGYSLQDTIRTSYLGLLQGIEEL